jgi:hypothetical protein
MNAIVIKHYVLHFKFILFLNYILIKFLIIIIIRKILYLYVNIDGKKIDCGKQLNMTLHEHITNHQLNF